MEENDLIKKDSFTDKVREFNRRNEPLYQLAGGISNVWLALGVVGTVLLAVGSIIFWIVTHISGSTPHASASIHLTPSPSPVGTYVIPAETLSVSKCTGQVDNGLVWIRVGRLQDAPSAHENVGPYTLNVYLQEGYALVSDTCIFQDKYRATATVSLNPPPQTDKESGTLVVDFFTIYDHYPQLVASIPWDQEKTKLTTLSTSTKPYTTSACVYSKAHFSKLPTDVLSATYCFK